MAGFFVFVGVAFALLVLYLAVMTLILAFSLKPMRIHQYISPGTLGRPQESVSFRTDDGLDLQGWWSEGSSDLVVIGVHGYIMNRCEWVPIQTFLDETQASCLFFDLRAHGRSQGSKIGFGTREWRDVTAAIEWVRNRKPGARIVLLGSSMGAVASVLAASKHPEWVEGLILDGAFRRLDEAMRGWWPFLGGDKLGKFMRPSEAFAPAVLGFRPADIRIDDELRSLAGKPILLLYGGADPLIPEGSRLLMLEAAGERGALVVFDGATHGAGRLNQPKKFEEEVLEFLSREGFIC